MENYKKIILYLVGIMFICFGIGALILTSSENNISNKKSLNKNSKNIDEKKSFDVAKVSTIDVSTTSCNINFIPSDKKELEVHFYGYTSSYEETKIPTLNCNIQNDKLKIEIDESVNKGTIFNFNFGYFRQELKLDLLIPSELLKDINIHTCSGNINMDNAKLKNLYVKSISGDFNAKEVICNELSFNTSSGKMNYDLKNSFSSPEDLNFKSTSGNALLRNCSFKNMNFETSSGNVVCSCNDLMDIENLHFKSISGDFKVNNLASKSSTIKTSSGKIDLNKVGGSLDFNSTSGDLYAEYAKSDASNISKLKTSSGKVTLRNFSGNLDGNSISGDIKVEYSNFNNNINLGTSSGRVDLTLPKNSEFSLKSHTSSGDIKCKFPIEISDSSKHNFEGTVKSNKNKLSIKTTSGNVNIVSE